MKQLFYSIILFASFGLLTSCATIIGGNQYTAHVKVENHPTAKIYHNDVFQGNGTATFKAKRAKANKFSITIKEDGCKDQTVNFVRKDFRGWAFLGTIVTWTFMTENNIPIPVGVAIDIANGALWKPSANEKGVIKTDFNNYIYQINYTGCEDETTEK